MIGAFGAHAMPNRLKAQGLDEATIGKRLENLEVGARYHMYHVLALLAVGLLQRSDPGFGGIAAVSFLLGILVFSGCLYAYSLTGIKTFAMIVPLGGVSMIVGWVSLAISFARRG
jgi:uncharacterized membrane protein YgdD (TMEM256/DUF423 family)